MAVVNWNYQFTMVDIGDAGRQSDGGVFAASNIGQTLDEGLLNIPPPRRLYGNTKLFPFVLVGDEAFPLKEYLIKPYARASIKEKEEVANYRISRQRRVVENTFGIRASRFRIFRRPIIASVDTVTSITKAVVALHNYLIHSREFGPKNDYCLEGFEDDHWRKEHVETKALQSLLSVGSHNYSRNAKKIRDEFRDYFWRAGSVPWQWEHVSATSDSFDER